MSMPLVFGTELFDELSNAARKSQRRRVNHNFHPNHEYPCHRLLIAIEPDSYIRPHRHSNPTKDETLVVLRGALGLLVFDDAGNVTHKSVLRAGGPDVGCNITAATFHTAICLETGTVLIESKAGPYEVTSDKDLAPWAAAEGGPEVSAYLAKWRQYFR